MCGLVMVYNWWMMKGGKCFVSFRYFIGWWKFVDKIERMLAFFMIYGHIKQHWWVQNEIHKCNGLIAKFNLQRLHVVDLFKISFQRFQPCLSFSLSEVVELLMEVQGCVLILRTSSTSKRPILLQISDQL